MWQLSYWYPHMWNGLWRCNNLYFKFTHCWDSKFNFIVRCVVIILHNNISGPSSVHSTKHTDVLGLEMGVWFGSGCSKLELGLLPDWAIESGLLDPVRRISSTYRIKGTEPMRTGTPHQTLNSSSAFRWVFIWVCEWICVWINQNMTDGNASWPQISKHSIDLLTQQAKWYILLLNCSRPNPCVCGKYNCLWPYDPYLLFD